MMMIVMIGKKKISRTVKGAEMTYHKEYTLHNGQKIFVLYDDHNVCKVTKECIEMLLDLYKQGRVDAIDEAKEEIVHHLNDYALQEAPIYQDDMDNQRPVYLAIKNCINGVIEIAEKLKGQKK